MDGLVTTGSSHKLAGTVGLDINSQRVFGVSIIKALYSIATSIVDGELGTVAQNQVQVALVPELAIQNNIIALNDEPVVHVFVTDGFIGIRSGINDAIKYSDIFNSIGVGVVKCSISCDVVVALCPCHLPEGEEGKEDE